MAKTFGVNGLALTIAGCFLVTACGGSGEYAASEDDTGSLRKPGPQNRYDPEAEGLFGKGGFTLNRLADGSLFGDKEDGLTGTATPVNKFLWQASLDTLSFMPLSSTDPYTGVIATDWSATPDAPGERFKVTVYMVSPELSAASLKVAVYRQRQAEGGNWVQTAVDPNTPRRLEDAILTRARQIRVAELEGKSTG
ncbi:MAG: DUF3576 domain-containing protein [Pseudomonadota bacterium]